MIGLSGITFSDSSLQEEITIPETQLETNPHTTSNQEEPPTSITVQTRAKKRKGRLNERYEGSKRKATRNAKSTYDIDLNESKDERLPGTQNDSRDWLRDEVFVIRSLVEYIVKRLDEHSDFEMKPSTSSDKLDNIANSKADTAQSTSQAQNAIPPISELLKGLTEIGSGGYPLTEKDTPAISGYPSSVKGVPEQEDWRIEKLDSKFSYFAIGFEILGKRVAKVEDAVKTGQGWNRGNGSGSLPFQSKTSPKSNAYGASSGDV